MTPTLPGLDLPAPPRSIADILRRVQARAEPVLSSAATNAAAELDTAALPLPTVRAPRRDAEGRAWHRHELKAGAYELRANGRAIVSVRPTPRGWLVNNIGAAIRDGLTAAEADALAARIARLMTAG